MITREKNKERDGLNDVLSNQPDIQYNIFSVSNNIPQLFATKQKIRNLSKKKTAGLIFLYNIPHIKKTGNRILAVLPSSQCYLNIFTPAHLNDFQDYSENDYSGIFPILTSYGSLQFFPSPKKQIQVLQHLH